MTHYLNFCSACAVTVVIFEHLNHSFYLLTFFLFLSYEPVLHRLKDRRTGNTRNASLIAA